MTKSELIMQTWERLLAEGVNVFSIFGTTDLKEITKRFHDLVIIKALKHCNYDISKTAKYLKITNRNYIFKAANEYLPNYKQLKAEKVYMRRLERDKIRKQNNKNNQNEKDKI